MTTFMNYCSYILLFRTIVVIFLVSLTTAGQRRQAINRSLRWVTKDSYLTYLTVEMSKMEEFKSLLKPMVVERVAGTDGNKAVQEHIKSFLEVWDVEEDRFTDKTPLGKKEFTNIIATLDPRKPIKVVLACHFDSKYFAHGKFVAASDSAVPCGILLETARQLQCLLEQGPKDTSSAKDLTLQLLFFDGEEAFKDWTATDSIYGSRHLAKRWTMEPDLANNNITRIDAIRELILLDLIGTRDTTIPQQFTSTSQLYNHLVKTEHYLRRNGYLTGKHPGPIFNGRSSGGGIEDDHIPFLKQGVDVVHLISSPFPSVWHRLSDDWAHLDFDLIDDFSRIFRVFVSSLMHLRPEVKGCRKKTHAEL